MQMQRTWIIDKTRWITVSIRVAVNQQKIVIKAHCLG
jgi:hypothetical protein